ncbi:MAG: phosphatase [Pirellulaceae bacterium]|nr:MAG: phosphatase [Pirellulaceae bacterium]
MNDNRAAASGGELKWPEPIRAVVFDLDGLLFNTEELYVEVGDRLVRRRGHRIEQALLDQMMGRPSPVALQIMIDWYGLDATVAQLQQETAEIFDELLPTRLRPMPGVLALLETLERHRMPRAVATSSRRSFAHRVLGQFGLVERFAFVLTCEDVTHGKPHPEIYVTAAGRLGILPSQMLVLEDSQLGCQAAVAAGSCTVAVPGPHNRHHRYPGARLVVDSLLDPRLWQLLAHSTGRPFDLTGVAASETTQ